MAQSSVDDVDRGRILQPRSWTPELLTWLGTVLDARAVLDGYRRI